MAPSCMSLSLVVLAACVSWRTTLGERVSSENETANYETCFSMGCPDGAEAAACEGTGDMCKKAKAYAVELKTFREAADLIKLACLDHTDEEIRSDATLTECLSCEPGCQAQMQALQEGGAPTQVPGDRCDELFPLKGGAAKPKKGGEAGPELSACKAAYGEVQQRAPFAKAWEHFPCDPQTCAATCQTVPDGHSALLAGRARSAYALCSGECESCAQQLFQIIGVANPCEEERCQACPEVCSPGTQAYASQLKRYWFQGRTLWQRCVGDEPPLDLSQIESNIFKCRMCAPGCRELPWPEKMENQCEETLNHGPGVGACFDAFTDVLRHNEVVEAWHNCQTSCSQICEEALKLFSGAVDPDDEVIRDALLGIKGACPSPAGPTL